MEPRVCRTVLSGFPLSKRHTKHKTRRTEEPSLLFGGTFDKTEFADGTAYFELYERRGTESMPPSFEETVSFADGTARLCVSDAGFSSRTNDKTVYLYDSDEARVISVIFVVVRAVCACLPEITALFGIEPALRAIIRVCGRFWQPCSAWSRSYSASYGL